MSAPELIFGLLLGLLLGWMFGETTAMMRRRKK